MTHSPVFWKGLREMRWQLFWYGAGLALIAALVVYVYPAYAHQLEDIKLPEAFRALFGDLNWSTPEGFVSAEFFSQWVSVILVIFAIMQGTSALGGEEAGGTMDLLLAQPISRTRLVVEKLLAFVTGTVIIATIITVGWFLSIPFVDIDLALTKPVWATFHLIPLTLAFGTFSAWAAAALPNRRVATGLVSAVAVATYVLNALAVIVKVLAPLQWLSPFHYYNGAEILTRGPYWAGDAALMGLAAAFFLLTVVAFNRRDIGVEGSLGMRDVIARLRGAQTSVTVSTSS